MRSLVTCAAALVIVALASGFAARRPMDAGEYTFPCVASRAPGLASPGVNATGRAVGDRVFATAYFARDPAGGPTRELVLFVRGAPGWHRGGPSVLRMNASPSDSARWTDASATDSTRWIIETRFRDLTLVGFLYPRAGLLRIAGAEVGLDTANVFLLDQVDGAGGAQTLRAAGCIQAAPLTDAIERAIVALPAVRDYIGLPTR